MAAAITARAEISEAEAITRAFSGQVDTGSPPENALNY